MLESMKKSKLQGFRDDVHWFASALGHRRRLDHSDCFCNLHGPLNVIIGGAQAPTFRADGIRRRWSRRGSHPVGTRLCYCSDVKAHWSLTGVGAPPLGLRRGHGVAVSRLRAGSGETGANRVGHAARKRGGER